MYMSRCLKAACCWISTVLCAKLQKCLSLNPLYLLHHIPMHANLSIFLSQQIQLLMGNSSCCCRALFSGCQHREGAGTRGTAAVSGRHWRAQPEKSVEESEPGQPACSRNVASRTQQNDGLHG